MQKKIIALAVAGLASGAAFAQSNVTIYGVADVGLNYATSQVDGAGWKTSVSSGQSAGSRIGFKGEEALGNGLKAIWTLEQGVAFDNGGTTSHGDLGGSAATGTNNSNTATTSVYARQAFAGLASNYGTVTFGRQYTPHYAAKANGDAFGLGLNGTMNNLAGYNPANADRLNNTVAYTSPTFAGFSGVVAYSAGMENNIGSGQFNATADNNGRAWAGLVQYAGYGAKVAVAYHDAIAASGVTAAIPNGTGQVNATGWVLSANYNIMNVATVYGLWSQGKADTIGANSTLAGKGRVWNLGVRVPFGAHTVIAQYTAAKNKLASVTNGDADLWGIGYEYALSKRTSLYASYAQLDNEAGVNNSMNGATTQTGLTNTTDTVTNGNDRKGLMLGMRHSF